MRNSTQLAMRSKKQTLFGETGQFSRALRMLDTRFGLNDGGDLDAIRTFQGLTNEDTKIREIKLGYRF